MFFDNCFDGGCLKDPLLNPQAYISRSSKIAPIEGNVNRGICSKNLFKKRSYYKARLFKLRTNIVIKGPTITFYYR